MSPVLLILAKNRRRWLGVSGAAPARSAQLAPARFSTPRYGAAPRPDQIAAAARHIGRIFSSPWRGPWPRASLSKIAILASHTFARLGRGGPGGQREKSRASTSKNDAYRSRRPPCATLKILLRKIFKLLTWATRPLCVVFRRQRRVLFSLGRLQRAATAHSRSVWGGNYF